ncbi:MAG: TetR/AcrR family transcriptional regulator [Thermodesulfobacteriota bacterium]
MPEAETPKKIMEAATAVFSREGFKGARMQQIARQAGVNQALLHYYFSSKENLYEEVLFRFFSSVLKQLAHHFGTYDSPEAALRGFINVYMDILKGNPDLPRLMVSEIIGGGSHMMAIADRIASEIGISPPNLIAPFIEKAAADGLIRPVDPRQTAISVIGMCLMYFVARPLVNHIWGKPVDEDGFLEKRKEAIADLVLYGLAKPERKST